MRFVDSKHLLFKFNKYTYQYFSSYHYCFLWFQQKNEIELIAARKSNWLAWAGLGLMSVQFGILARLTWWEYSWDIMEPVTYFVTYGTAMACYAYFVVTKEVSTTEVNIAVSK